MLIIMALGVAAHDSAGKWGQALRPLIKLEWLNLYARAFSVAFLKQRWAESERIRGS
jgi:hypothetical protein